MSSDIRIPADRIEESRLIEYNESLRPIQFRTKDLIVILTLVSVASAGLRAVITHADKPSDAVLHSRP